MNNIIQIPTRHNADELLVYWEHNLDEMMNIADKAYADGRHDSFMAAARFAELAYKECERLRGVAR